MPEKTTVENLGRLHENRSHRSGAQMKRDESAIV